MSIVLKSVDIKDLIVKFVGKNNLKHVVVLLDCDIYFDLLEGEV